MAIGVRDITNLEELLEIQDDDKIIVIQNGEAKLISKANAKFGGGTFTIFYAEQGQEDYQRLVDVDGNPISAQAAYDAIMSGRVYICIADFIEGSNDPFFISVTFFQAKRINGEIATVVFAGTDGTFYAGDDPRGDVS